MARPPRVHYYGAIFHVMSRGNYGQDIFVDEQDFCRFIQILGQAKKRFACQIYAYCLLSNHFHVLIRVADIPISSVVHWIKTCYAKYFNLRRARVGHLFQGRFNSILCENDRYFLELLRYIHLNPVRARQVERPGDWTWTGHKELSGEIKPRLLDVGLPLSVFHADAATAMSLYSQFVYEGVGDCVNSPDPFAAAAPNATPASSGDAEVDAAVLVRPSLTEISADITSESGLAIDALRGAGRKRTFVNARRLLAQRAVSRGVRPFDIAAFLGCTPSAISKYLRVGCGEGVE